MTLPDENILRFHTVGRMFASGMETFRVTSRKDGRSVAIPIESGFTLAQHLFIAGALKGRPLCSGAGRCGLCQVEFATRAPKPLPEETERISPARLLAGWRLACKHPPVPDAEVFADCAADEMMTTLPEPCAGDARAYLGIDLGTTSIEWRFVRDGLTAQGSLYNPQLGAGSEIMSRLALARTPSGARALKNAVAGAVRAIVSALPCLPQRICLAGNTAMTYLALGLDVSGLAAAPYRVDWPGREVARLSADLPGIYIPPLVAPFVGADVCCGLLDLERRADAPNPPWLLADLGTNAEFALVLPSGEVLVASVPMGPALEGVGMSQGRLAGPSVAAAFEIVPSGLAPVFFGGGRDGELRGISGTGYLSLAAKLRRLGVVEESGRFAKAPISPLAAKILEGLQDDGGERCLHIGDVALYASDVEALLKVKAAFCVAVTLLLDHAGLCFTSLSEMSLAGALGAHVNGSELEVLGFFPPGGAAKIRAVGNASLAGACLAAQDDEARQWLAGLSGRVTQIDVAAAPDFQRLYLEAMSFAP